MFKSILELDSVIVIVKKRKIKQALTSNGIIFCTAFRNILHYLCLNEAHFLIWILKEFQLNGCAKGYNHKILNAGLNENFSSSNIKKKTQNIGSRNNIVKC